jgi:hypothetical protein
VIDMSLRVVMLVSALCLGAAACEPDPTIPPVDCDERASSEATGRWTLTAKGTRSDCQDEDLNGDLTLELRPFFVEGVPLTSDGTDQGVDVEHEADAFVERIRRSRYRLEISADQRTGFEFEGTSDTCKLDFLIREELKGDDYHEYEFHGFVAGPGNMYGTFTGHGPGRCQSEGRFDITAY